MLKLSTKGDYGIVFMLELAKRYKTGLVSLSEFAKQSGISGNYLHQIIRPLSRRGLIRSKEGMNGGFALKKDPKSITLLEIIESLEGPLRVVRCTVSANVKCPHQKSCAGEQAWSILQEELATFFQQKTLADIVKKT